MSKKEVNLKGSIIKMSCKKITEKEHSKIIDIIGKALSKKGYGAFLISKVK